MSLRAYVRRRTGVPLGHRASLRNMLHRAFGASSFAGFWRYWNPIWSYHLSRYVDRPARGLLPASLATLLTFAVSGMIHDAVIMALRGEFALFFTPWFVCVALSAIAGEALGWRFGGLPWAGRATLQILNLAFMLALSVAATHWLGQQLGRDLY